MAFTQGILTHGHGRALNNLELVQWWKKRWGGGKGGERERELRERAGEKEPLLSHVWVEVRHLLPGV